MRAGVYQGTAYAENVVNYPCDEMDLILEGEIEIVDEDGTNQIFRPGECGWSGYLRALRIC